MKVVWSPRALDDIAEIANYIAQHNPAAARKIAGRIRQIGNSLREHPRMGPSDNVPGMRRRAVTRTRYVLHYYVLGDSIEIVSVMHGARQWPPEAGE